MKIKITCDSTCDLSPELYERYDIGVIPLHIIKDGTSFADTLEITPDDIFAHVGAGGAMCSTAAANIDEYTEAFAGYLKEYDAVVHINISSEFSTCYQNACIAAEELGSVYPVDSRSLSTGSGLLAIDAALMAGQGTDAAEIAARLREMTAKLDVSFILDTLKYLHLGGRCSGVAALGANLLSLRPCIEVKDGKMGVGKKYRGKSSVCMKKYVEERLSGRDDLDLRRIFITHSGIEPELIGELRELVAGIAPFSEIIITRAGCTISNHCGPRCMGVLFYTK